MNTDCPDCDGEGRLALIQPVTQAGIDDNGLPWAGNYARKTTLPCAACLGSGRKKERS